MSWLKSKKHILYNSSSNDITFFWDLLLKIYADPTLLHVCSVYINFLPCRQ